MMILISLAYGKIWTVDNNEGNNADYTSLQEAHDGAAGGDTIYVVGSGVGYGDLTLTNTLFLFGPGYFLGENPGNQMNTASAKIGQISFSTGSEGSQIVGFSTGSITINAGNISLKRNYIVHNTGYGSTLSINASNVIVAQNYIVNPNDPWNYQGLGVGGGQSGIIINNNYIRGPSSSTAINVHSTSSATIESNVLRNGIAINNSVFRNNIIIANVTYTSISFGSSNNVINNVFTGTISTTDPPNWQYCIFGATEAELFVGADGNSSDGQFQLAEGSPALGAGYDGVDCGIFGGTDPYVLSGIPAIPTIYFFDAPITGSASAGLTVKVKVKSNR